MENVYLGRQPIVDSNSAICAYEILYRDKNKQSNIDGDRHASASVINSVLNVFGTKSLLGDHKAFIKIDEKFLMHDIIFTVPKEFFIFSLLSKEDMSERVVERIRQLHAKGYQLCINNASLLEMDRYAVIFKELTHMEIDFERGMPSNVKDIIKKLKSYNITVIATKIETTKDYILAKELGCEWFEGYFFAEPKIIENERYEPSQSHILKLYNLLLEDVSIDEITKEFEANHEITVKLLQFINSGVFHFRQRISSIHHILVLVGRIPLAQWLMLMIYSKSVSKDNMKSPLMLMVKSRTELMENILKAVDKNAGSNMMGEAYFVGVLSLVDTIFSVKLETVLEDMHVSDEVKYAILYDEGILGDIFSLVRDIEAFDTYAISEFEKRHRLQDNVIKNIVLQSIKEVNSFENPGLSS
ncbi:EAL domain-containing protein [Sulfurimonas sp. HSL-1716]|uniref:EAL and HDOD domain-containing protein n=1 Tax=Hydrocurvibacter sulfurireducens TaxID=3131937 RepID=UPI0031F81A7D